MAAKFTVFFKEKPIRSELFENGIIHIGRDDTNEIIIDSLTIAPAHAVVTITEQGCLIKQLNEKYPLEVNDKKIKDQMLKNGDCVNIGKHSIIFNSTETISPTETLSTRAQEDLDSLNEEINSALILSEAKLQVMSGVHIGRIIPIKKTMTQLGKSGSGVLIISKRKEGYFLSALETDPTLKINDKLLDDETFKLSNNDLVTIDDTAMQFFIQ